jgi:hypothetical protein
MTSSILLTIVSGESAFTKLTSFDVDRMTLRWNHSFIDISSYFYLWSPFKLLLLVYNGHCWVSPNNVSPESQSKGKNNSRLSRNQLSNFTFNIWIVSKTLKGGWEIQTESFRRLKHLSLDIILMRWTINFDCSIFFSIKSMLE